MYGPEPVWKQWPYPERASRQPKRRRKPVRGGRWFVMKAPRFLARSGKRGVAINLTKHRSRWFHTWGQAIDYALDTTRRAYLDSRSRER